MHGRGGGACVVGGMHGRGVCMVGHAACMVGGGMCGGGHVRQRGVHGGGGVRGRRDGHYSGRYASYWNAFLFIKKNLRH